MARKNSDKVLFGTSLGGYNKTDVNEYIADLDEKHARAEASSRAERDELCERVSAAEQRAETCEGELARIVALKVALDAENGALKEKLEAALASDKANSDRVRETEGELEAARCEILRLTSELEDSRNSVTLDVIEAQTAHDAASGAEKILRAAREEAEQMRRTAELELELARESVRRSSDEALREIYEMIEGAVGESLGEILKSVHETETAVAKTSDGVAKKNWAAKAKITHIKARLEADIEKRIADIGAETGREARKEAPKSASEPKSGGNARSAAGASHRKNVGVASRIARMIRK